MSILFFILQTLHYLHQVHVVNLMCVSLAKTPKGFFAYIIDTKIIPCSLAESKQCQ